MCVHAAFQSHRRRGLWDCLYTPKWLFCISSATTVADGYTLLPAVLHCQDGLEVLDAPVVYTETECGEKISVAMTWPS